MHWCIGEVPFFCSEIEPTYVHIMYIAICLQSATHNKLVAHTYYLDSCIILILLDESVSVAVIQNLQLMKVLITP